MCVYTRAYAWGGGGGVQIEPSYTNVIGIMVEVAIIDHTTSVYKSFGCRNWLDDDSYQYLANDFYAIHNATANCSRYINLKQGANVLIICIYVDDGLVIGNNKEMMDECIRHLKTVFEMKVGEPDTFVGIKITRNENNIVMSQPTYTKENQHQRKPCPVDYCSGSEIWTSTYGTSIGLARVAYKGLTIRYLGNRKRVQLSNDVL